MYLTSDAITLTDDTLPYKEQLKKGISSPNLATLLHCMVMGKQRKGEVDGKDERERK